LPLAWGWKKSTKVLSGKEDTQHSIKLVAYPDHRGRVSYALFRKRDIVETTIDQLTNITQTEHSKHPSPTHFMVFVIYGLIAYGHRPKNPSLNLDFALLQVA
jgi:hypothetical protein